LVELRECYLKYEIKFKLANENFLKMIIFKTPNLKKTKSKKILFHRIDIPQK